VICIVILKSTVPVWAKTEERGLSWGEYGFQTGCGLETAALREPVERGREKNEEPHITSSLPPPPFSQEPSTPLSKAPTGSKKWSYFDNYHRLPPSTANNLGVQANCTVQASVRLSFGLRKIWLVVSNLCMFHALLQTDITLHKRKRV
jgi:hypothetical protein